MFVVDFAEVFISLDRDAGKPDANRPGWTVKPMSYRESGNYTKSLRAVVEAAQAGDHDKAADLGEELLRTRLLTARNGAPEKNFADVLTEREFYELLIGVRDKVSLTEGDLKKSLPPSNGDGVMHRCVTATTAPTAALTASQT